MSRLITPLHHPESGLWIELWSGGVASSSKELEEESKGRQKKATGTRVGEVDKEPE